MLLSRFVYTKMASPVLVYWRALGYVGGRNERIKVKVEHLQAKSNVKVACRCDDCGKKYINRFSRNHEVCKSCWGKRNATGNSWGSVGKGKKNPSMSGEKHPRWNPNKKAYAAYSYKVHRLTKENYERDIEIINPMRLPRTLCGVDGGFQLDHKVSIKKGFEMGINPKWIAATNNLQMLSWQDNLAKQNHLGVH